MVRLLWLRTKRQRHGNVPGRDTSEAWGWGLQLLEMPFFRSWGHFDPKNAKVKKTVKI
jgi:hypothetical protein